jgi:hypothetical protein
VPSPLRPAELEPRQYELPAAPRSARFALTPEARPAQPPEQASPAIYAEIALRAASFSKSVLPFGLAATRMRTGWALSPAAQPVERLVMPVRAAVEAAVGAPSVALPELPFDALADGGLTYIPDAQALPIQFPAPVESLMSPVSQPVLTGLAALAQPILPVFTAAPTGLPEPGFQPLDFYSVRGHSPIAHQPEWQVPDLAAMRPPLLLPIAIEAVVEIVAPAKKSNKVTSIFNRRRLRVMAEAVKTVAAGLVIGALLWYGLTSIQHAPSLHYSSGDSGQPQQVASARSGASAPHPGWFGRVRHVLSERAASEMDDSFHSMTNWGVAAGTLPPGWSHHRDGYTRPGQLALFHPSLTYSDYRMEFFGQVERKSMDWVVRAKDPQNYYAMKFAVIEPGLRPVLAMVHYPVVDGRRGRRLTVPLNVMIHDHTPYRVAVDVRGDHIVTSIEGQEVDTWIDTTLPKGGIGFFAEAGEQSRIYWMKLSRNQDLIGKICAILSRDAAGGSERAAQSVGVGSIYAALGLFTDPLHSPTEFWNYRRYPWHS